MAENTKFNQRILRAVFEQNLKNNDIPTLEQALYAAKTVSVPQSLHYKALIAVGDSYFNPRGYHIAFEHYYTARKFTKKVMLPLLKASESLRKFFWENELTFSVKDLKDLLKVSEHLRTILNTHVIDPALQKNMDDTIRRIHYRIKYTAPDIVESKVTFRTNHIKDAFYTEMSFQEMQNELARLTALMIINDDSETSEEKIEVDKKTVKPKPKQKKKKPTKK